MDEDSPAPMTRFENTRLISARALQLSMGAPPLVKPLAESTPYAVAKEELSSNKIPLAVVRRLPDGRTERMGK